MKVLFLLIEINRYTLVPEVLKSNIFFSAANCLRPYLSISDKTINMVISLRYRTAECARNYRLGAK